MSGTPAVYYRPEHRSGTTWDGRFRVRVRIGGVVKDLSNATARLVWSDALGEVLATWTIGGGLVVPDPSSGYLYVVGPGGSAGDPDDTLTMIGGVLTAPPGTLRGELVITLADGTVTEPLEVSLPISDGYAL